MANCPDCGGPTTSARGNHPYDESGIRGILLMNVEINRCGRCPWKGVVLPERDDLIDAIARWAEVGELRLVHVDGKWRRAP